MTQDELMQKSKSELELAMREAAQGATKRQFPEIANGGRLALALSKAQGEMQGAKKDANNPFFKSKYADLASVWEACRDALAKNEIAVFQIPEVQNGVAGIRTKLQHSSGEFEQGFFPLSVPATAKAQDMGSAMTYLRRYALAAIVGVSPEDDDGNAAQNAVQPKQKAPSGTFSRKIPEEKPEHNPQVIDADGVVNTLDSPSDAGFGNYITDEQLMTLSDFITAQNIPMSTQKAWLDRAGISKITDLPTDKAQLLIDSLKGKANG